MAEWRSELNARLATLRLRPEREAEIVEELSQHLDDRVRELLAEGEAPELARQTTLEELDAPGELARRLAAIEVRSPYTLPPPGAPARGRWVSALGNDARYAVASLRRTPGFTLAVVATLALTIGPTTAILSIGNWLIWRPPPGVVQPDRLAVVWFGEWKGPTSVSPRGVSDLNLADILAVSSTISSVGGWQESPVSCTVEGASPRICGSAHATAAFFDVLGVRPAVGRLFTAEEDRPPYGSPVVVLGDSFARGVFGTPESAVGRAITINGRRLTAVGVLPPGFVGASPFSDVDVWFPGWTYYYVRHFSEASMRSRTARSDGVFYTFVIRLAPGATFDALRAELDVLVPALADRYPEDNEAFQTVRARVFPELGPQELQRGHFQGLVGQLLMVAGVLLLLGCANVANLLISRGARRHREHAVRVALGATRGRLVRLLLTESTVLSLAGAAAGVAGAFWLRNLIQALLLPEAGASGVDIAVPMDLRVLVGTLGVSVACGMLSGLVPAWLGSSICPSSALGVGVRVPGGGARFRTTLAVVQLALSVALVANALLLVATLRNLTAVDVGFDPAGVTVHHLDLGSHGYDAERSMAYDRELLARLSLEPAFEAVSLSSNYHFGSGHRMDIHDPAGDEDARLPVVTNFVTEGYFNVLRLPVLEGRSFTPAETMGGAGLDGTPVIVDERLARRLFGEANPHGRNIRVPRSDANPSHHLTVVGVARGTRWRGLTDEPEPVMYLPFTYGRGYGATRPVVMVRSRLPARETGDLVQARGSAIDASLPFMSPRLLSESIADEGARQRVFAGVLSLLGSLGFVLAAVGLHGLLAQLVIERTREFGIRVAIGAGRAHVFGLVLRQAMWITVSGGLAGLILAGLGSRLVEAQLFGLGRLEPWVYATSAASLAVVVFLAGSWPARSAARIQPVEALRME